MRIIILLTIITSSLVFCACGTTSNSVSNPVTKGNTYPGIYEEHPVAIAIMPPINKTNNVEAKEFFYYTLSKPLSEQGYYVFPPLLTMEMFKTESAYDSELFIDGSVKKFGEILGADAVLFTTISQWEKLAAVGTVEVEVEYTMRSTKTDEILFQRKGNIVHDASVKNDYSDGGLAGVLVGALADIVATSISASTLNHINVARDCNTYVISDLSAGKYSPRYDMDQDDSAGPKVFNKTIKVE